MMTIQSFFNNSTPLNKFVVSELGLTKGAVACKVIYASNLSDNVCRMGLTRMAKELGINKSTVSRALSDLCDEGWINKTKLASIEDNQPAHYQPTDKLLSLLQDATPPVAERNSPVAERNQDKKLNKSSNNKQTDDKSSPPGKKPKTAIKDRFIELTNLKMPKNKSQVGFWWSQFGEILDVAGDSEDDAIKALEQVIPYMQENHLTITGPQSVLGLCRSVLAGQQLNGGGRKGDGPNIQSRDGKNTLVIG